MKKNTNNSRFLQTVAYALVSIPDSKCSCMAQTGDDEEKNEKKKTATELKF